MAPEEQRTSDFAMRMAFALEKDPTEGPRRTHVTLKIILVTLAWFVVVPLMVTYGMTGKHRGDDVFTLAALTNLVLPFSAAVIATRNKRSGVAGFYIVLTLLMIFPSLAISHAG